jgi:hypothetical protein
MVKLCWFAGLAISLALMEACGGEGTEPSALTGALEVIAAASGDLPSPGPNLILSLDGGGAVPIGLEAPRVFPDLPPGDHQILLGGMPASCELQGSNPRPAAIIAGDTAQVRFELACPALPGAIAIALTVSGDAPTTKGFAATLDGVLAVPLAEDGSGLLTQVAPGSHEVGITGGPSNCTARPNPVEVFVASNTTSRVSFQVTCSATGTNLVIRTSTTLVNHGGDPNGYLVTIDGRSPPLVVNDRLVVPVEPGSHSVRLGGFASGCGVFMAPNPVSVVVPENVSVTVTFNVLCIG